MKPTITDFSDLVGISVRAATDLRTRGIIPKRHETMHDLVRPYCAHMREIAAGRSSEKCEFDLTAERARLSHHQANIAALDEEVKKKTLIPAEHVKARWSDMLAAFRARMLALPSRMASSCVGMTEAQIEREVRDGISLALDELTRGDGVD